MNIMHDLQKKFKLILIFIIIPVSLLCNNKNIIFNPFKNNFGSSMLDYNRFKTFHQFSFLSVNNKQYSRSYGIHLSTIQYNVNNNLIAYLHLGNKINFNDKNTFQLKEKKDYLTGGSLIYKSKSNFTLGIEYGDTPNHFNIFNSPFFINSFSSLSYLENIGQNNNLKLWLNKSFNKNVINIHIYYHQSKIQNYRKD